MRAQHNALEEGEVVANTVDLISRARQRTLEELNTLACNDSVSYGVAVAGNTPHVVLPNGITVVMRKCGTWGC